jgi:hypothetical protein
MDKVQKHDSSKCIIPSSEPFRIESTSLSWTGCRNHMQKFILSARSCGCKAWASVALYGQSLSSFVAKAAHDCKMLVSCARCLSELCHGSSSLSHGPHCGVPGLCPGESIRDLWWKKWHWYKFYSEFFGFPCQYHSIMALHSHVSGGWAIGPLEAEVQGLKSHPTDMSNKMSKWFL